jgi:hypothetical protein
MKRFRAKRAGFGLQIQTFTGKSGKTYTVFKTTKGSYHAFVETEAKRAARDCGARGDKNTRDLWKSIW